MLVGLLLERWPGPAPAYGQNKRLKTEGRREKRASANSQPARKCQPAHNAGRRATLAGAQTQPTHTNVVVQEGTLTSLELWNSGSVERRSAATHTHTRRTTSAQSSASAQTQPAHNASQRATPAGAQTQPARNSSQRIASASAQTQLAHKPSWRNMSEFQIKATHISLAHLDRLHSAVNLEEDWSKQLQLAEERNDT